MIDPPKFIAGLIVIRSQQESRRRNPNGAQGVRLAQQQPHHHRAEANAQSIYPILDLNQVLYWKIGPKTAAKRVTALLLSTQTNRLIAT
jgi:hypothetical protein